MLAESANLLMMPGRARDQGRWMKDARLMLDAGWAAFKAAKAKDVPALEALSDQMYESCTTCHQHYRPGYGKKPTPEGQFPYVAVNRGYWRAVTAVSSRLSVFERVLDVAAGAHVVDLGAGVEDGVAIVRFGGAHGFLAGVDERTRLRHPLAAVLGAAAHHQQVAGLGDDDGGIPRRVPVLGRRRRDLGHAFFVDDGPDGAPVDVGGRVHHRRHELLDVGDGLEGWWWRAAARGEQQHARQEKTERSSHDARILH